MEQGAKIFLVGNNDTECAALSAQLTGSAYAVADVADAAEVESAVERAFQQFGSVDGVFNVAGLSGRSFGDGPLHECTEEGWLKMMNVHAGGAFHVSKSVIARWLESGSKGAIVHMGSILARHPEPTHFATLAYAASKGAVESLTISAASYYAPRGIRLNAIAASLVRTPMSRRAQSNPEILELMKRKQPLIGDLLDVTDVARVALFLLSDAAQAITGQVIRVDGGWSVSG
jgi:NAD(P)-dependent dehydrogenase (short-subunit alcohol dehydrogenase family)